MPGLFAHPGPRWFSIAAHRPFVDDLAAALLAEFAPHGPEALADAVVLTPTRRGARSLAEAFVGAAGGRAVLLPQIRTLGDLDEGEPPFEPGEVALGLPPAIAPLRRRFELARLVLDNASLFERPITPQGALALAQSLAAFLDSAAIEELDDADRVDRLVEGELARHWQVSAEFLRLATRAWPARLAELGLADVNARRIAVLRALGRQWSERPPARPLMAAGSTGTAPAVADLLAVVARAPQGAVVLPGLDQDLAQSAWEQVGEAHPQGALRRLLDRAGVDRAEVRPWPAPESAAAAARGRTRRRVVNEALRPPEATADWRAQIAALRAEGEASGVDPIAEGLAGLALVTARGEEDAAAVIALLLRETLETPGATAALVTPDQTLARRVSARLARFGVVADASAGAPLAGFPVGVLLGLVAGFTAAPLDPATTLAILKHPLTRLGLSSEVRGPAARALERRAFRGARARSWAKVDARLDEAEARVNARSEDGAAEQPAGLVQARDVAQRLRSALALAATPFAHGLAPLPDAARALVEAVEMLATGGRRGSRRPGLGRLWAGPDGEAAAALMSELLGGDCALPPVDAAAFADILDGLLQDATVREAGVTHPRVRILGAIEARLVRADRLVLAGLEEGVWPAPAQTDPFLSRPMRASLGLPPPERRIGLSAHDFAQAACAPDVTLVHCERRGGQPAVESRWLWRLRTLARGAELAIPGRPEALAWARALDAPIRPTPPSLHPAPRPAPTPPVALRPRKLPVTSVERWVRDPYAIYARHVLGLRAMDRPDRSMEAMARGSALHKAFERFATAHPEAVPDDAHALFEALFVAELEAGGITEAALHREAILARRLAAFAAAFEAERRGAAPSLLIEQEGAHTFEAPAGVFTVTAKADRIEVAGGHAHVLDFKTGAIPSQKQVEAGFSPQLTLTAAIVARGGFGHHGVAPGELLYVKASGLKVAGSVESRGGPGESAALADAALEGLMRQVARFDEARTPYLAWTAPQFMAEHGGEYDHLSRLFEWHVMGEGAEEPA